MTSTHSNTLSSRSWAATLAATTLTSATLAAALVAAPALTQAEAPAPPAAADSPAADTPASPTFTSTTKPTQPSRWRHTGDYREWSMLSALERGQGVTSDGTSLYFSGTVSLVKSTLDGRQDLASNPVSIPLDLYNTYGVRHIGDIAVHDGHIVAPLEDGSDYLNPLLALYNTSDLQYTGHYVRLPEPVLPEGVPWVTVDSEAGLVYTSPWNHSTEKGTDQLVIFRLADVLDSPTGTMIHPVQTVRLSQPLSRIQGTTLLRGKLYAAVDGREDKAVWSIDPTTGEVTREFTLGVYPDDEVEGIASIDRGADGADLIVGNVGSDLRLVNMFYHRYTLTN